MTEAPSLYAYLLMRTDLESLGVGKARAQAMHAGNHMTHELWVKPLLAGAEVDSMVVEWHAQGGGFGTAIAIGAANQVTLEVLDSVVVTAATLGIHAGRVVDETYPFVVSAELLPLMREDLFTAPPMRAGSNWRCFRRETTAAWLLGNKSELSLLLDRFDLTPDR